MLRGLLRAAEELDLRGMHEESDEVTEIVRDIAQEFMVAQRRYRLAIRGLRKNKHFREYGNLEKLRNRLIGGEPSEGVVRRIVEVGDAMQRERERFMCDEFYRELLMAEMKMRELLTSWGRRKKLEE